jgi:Arylsulfotransferase (ASST)
VAEGTGNKDGTTAAPSQTKRTGGPGGRLSFCLLVFGLLSLGYVLGASVMFLDLPSSGFLRRALVGGATWYYQKHGSDQKRARSIDGTLPPLRMGKIDRPDRTWDGFTLCFYGSDCHAVLIDMRGEVVHEWHTPFSSIWPNPPHLRGPIDDAKVFFNDGRVFPNGDLLVVIEGTDLKNATEGYGLARLDRDSNVLWKYPGNCHHDLDVGDDGTIYAIAHSTVDELPKELDYVPAPCLVDCVDILSPNGKLLKRISLLQALKNSPYAPLLCLLERPRVRDGLGLVHPGLGAESVADDLHRRDVLHANCVKVLNPRQAGRFPMFRPGQLLVSSNHLDSIGVLDPDSEKIIWAARGPWHGQHDPNFLDDGHLLLFDNLGSPRGSRVLEYDPGTQAFPWSYPGENGKPFYSRLRGANQRLPNGNTLIVSSDAGEMFEVTSDQAIVWSCSCAAELYHARRYTADQLPFLNARPARP